MPRLRFGGGLSAMMAAAMMHVRPSAFEASVTREKGVMVWRQLQGSDVEKVPLRGFSVQRVLPSLCRTVQAPSSFPRQDTHLYNLKNIC